MYKITEKQYNEMPFDLQVLFEKLPNQSKEEVLAGFPNTKSGTMKAGVAKHSHWAKNNFDNPETYGDEGSAARFFYCAKTSSNERNYGLYGFEEKELSVLGNFSGTEQHGPKQNIRSKNHHPTVKPLALMKYLIKIVTPPKGIVLDPFAGSGSTLVAAKELKFNFIGIEKESEYLEIGNARLEAVVPTLL